MSAGLVIHAAITVRGDAADRAACAGRIRAVLDAQAIEGQAAEHHGAEALCYDLKVKGGIPFPVFAEVSLTFPGLTFTVEWVNLEAGQRGAATIIAGKLLRRDAAALTGQSRAPVCVRVTVDGRLELACAVMRFGPDECRGYAIEAGHDAVFRAVCAPGGAVELVATDGALEWALAWRGPLDGGAFEREAFAPPQPIPEAEYADLERLAQTFVAEWVWLAEDPEKEIAVERERRRRRGYAEHAANVRSGALARIEEAGIRRGGVLVYDTLPEELRWVEELLTRCWLAGPPGACNGGHGGLPGIPVTVAGRASSGSG